MYKIIRSDGTEIIDDDDSPPTMDAINAAIGAKSSVMVWAHRDPINEVSGYISPTTKMFVNTAAECDGLPPNAKATALYWSGRIQKHNHQICGDVVIVVSLPKLTTNGL